MSLLNKEPVKRAEKALKEFDETLSVTELKNTARTAVDAAKSLNCEVGAIVKSLLFKNGENYFLCLVSGDKRCSLNKLKKFFNSKDLSIFMQQLDILIVYLKLVMKICGKLQMVQLRN